MPENAFEGTYFSSVNKIMLFDQYPPPRLFRAVDSKFSQKLIF